jgi:hypothetical protein
MFNPRSVPIEIGYYLAGFADGEGSFNISFRRRGNDYHFPWRVSACFNISQRDEVILALFQRYLECGTLRQRRDGVVYYEVNNLRALRDNIIPFFKNFGFLSAKKKRDFSKFCQLVEILERGEFQTKEGIEQILAIRREMNDGGKRKFEEEHILGACGRGPESSETIRRTSMPIASIEDDIVRPPQRCGEAGRNGLPVQEATPEQQQT